MASIQSLGVGSGLLTSDLVEDIIAAEREATDLRLGAKRAEFEAKISAFGSLQSQLATLDSASSQLASSGSLLLNSVTSTDESVVTATVNSTATPGIHTVDITSTARAHTLTSIRFDSADSVVGDGTLDFRFGTTTFSGGAYDTFSENEALATASITIDSSNNTLDGVRDAINAANVGVTASVVDDGQGFLLVLKSDQTGADYSMEITVTEGGTAGLSALAFNAGAAVEGTNFTQSVAASDAVLTVDGIPITRETNTVSGVIEGLTFNLLADSDGSEVTVSVQQDTEAITSNLQSFIDAYNSVKSLADELSAYDTENNIAGLLTGDSTIRSVLSQMRRFIGESIPDVSSSSIRALIDIGISTNQDLGFQLQLDSTKFQSALAANPDDVLALLASQSRASDSQISVNGYTSETQAGSYTVDITQAATQGTLTGAVTAGLASTITIDDDNDTLSIEVDGVTSSSITLAQGSYTDGTELAQELESQINADATLLAAGASVEVNYDSTNQQLVLSSTTFGSESNIGIVSVDVDTETDFGLSVVAASGNVGTDVAGTINGIEGTGVGQFLSIPSGEQAATSGQYSGSGVTTFDSLPVTIDADNDTFRVSVDGLLSEDIVLTNSSYNTADELATEIQTQINADATLLAAEITVGVVFDDANNRFEITSASTGTSSSVDVTFAEAGVVSDLGLVVAQGVDGVNATNIANPAAGFQIQVQGSTIGERGTVTLVRGVMDRLTSYLSQVTQFDGTISNRVSGLETSVADLEEEASEFATRMDLLEERLRLQFAAADALISTLNNTSSFLDQQLATLPGYTRSNE